MNSNTYQHRRGTTTINQKDSLFEQLLKGTAPPDKEQLLLIPVDIDKQNKNEGISKSLKNLTTIFYQKRLDFEDFKISLKYNNKNLQKIAFDSIKEINPKLLKQLCKHDLCGLQELKLKEIPILDSSFEVFKSHGGFQQLFPRLKNLEISSINCLQIVHTLTSEFLQYIFVNKLSNINLETLDFKYCQIDQKGLLHLTDFTWPLLKQLGFQWCTKFNEISLISTRSKNFPVLKTLDLRFTSLENEQVQKLISSDLIFSLTAVKVFGSKVEFERNQWNNSWFINQICKLSDTYKSETFSFWHVKDEGLLTANQKRFMNQQQFQGDKTVGQVGCQILVDPDTRVNIFVKWRMNFKNTTILINESFPQKSDSRRLVSVVSDYVRTKQKKIKKLDIFIMNDIVTYECLKSISDAISSLDELLELYISYTNQKNISQLGYSYLFSSFQSVEFLQNLQLILPQNNIKVDKLFLEPLLRNIQNLSFLNTFILVTTDNPFNQDDILEFLKRLILNEKGNFWLIHILVIFTSEQVFWSIQDVIDLYFTNPFREVQINLENNVLGKENISKRKLIASLIQLSQITRKKLFVVMKLVENIKQNLRSQIWLDLILNLMNVSR